MTNEQKLLYLAGIIDGEGHITIVPIKNGRGKSYLTPRMVVTQKDVRLITWLKDNFGGHAYTYTNPKYPWSRWELRGKPVVLLVKQLHPYLIVKKEQSDPIFNL